MTLIDLGYRDAEEGVGWSLDRRLRRRIPAGLVALLCLLTLGASARPRDGGLRLAWSVDQVNEAAFTVVGDTVLVIGGPQNEILTGYALADGAVRWSRTFPGVLPFVTAGRGSSVVLLPSGQQAVTDAYTSGYIFTRTGAMDAPTGRDLWQVPGSQAALSYAGTVLLEEHEPGSIATARLRLVRLADGGTVWSRETPGVQAWVLAGADPDRPDRIATVTGGGEARMLSLADGSELGAGTVEWPPDPSGQYNYQFMAAHGDDFYVLRTDRQTVTATAYSGSTLRRLWTVTKPVSGDNAGLQACGPVLCLSTGKTLIGYDWVTGAVRWQDLGQSYAGSAGSDLLLGQSSDYSRRLLIAMADGRIVADLGAARPAGTPGDAPPAAGDPVITIAPGRNPPGRTVVRRVDPRTGETFVLGTVEAVDDSGCTAAPGRLLCRTLPGRLTVTAFG